MPRITREYKVDLSLPAGERWAKIIEDEKQNTIRLIDNAMREMKDTAGPLGAWVAKKVVPLIYDIRGAAFGDDIGVWSDATGIPREELVLANLSYELSQTAGFVGSILPDWSRKWFGCTALAFNRKGNGGVAHVRNMDWPLQDCGRLSAILHYTGGKSGPFTSVGWPCFAGVISGFAPGRFSITLNQAPQVGMVNVSWPAAFALRIIFEECQTFDMAVNRLKRFELAASALFMVVGTKRDQALVIEHTGKKAYCRWMKDGVLSLANHFEIPKLTKYNPKNRNVSDPQENSKERAAFALKSARKGARLPARKMLSLLNRAPVLFEQTAQRMAFVPKTGERITHYW